MSRKVTCEFFYFGVSCFFRTSIDVPHTFLSEVLRLTDSNLSSFRNFETIKNVITTDMRTLADANVGGLKKGEPRTKWAANGKFQQLNEEYTYVYVHEMHASLSDIEYSQLQGCFLTSEEVLREYPVCKDHSNHDFLAPYFMDNETLVQYYTAISLGDDTNRKQKAIEQLAVLNGKCVDQLETPYVAPATTCNNWNENDWTKRLFHCIRDNYTSKVYYTAIHKFSQVLVLLRCSHLLKNAWCFQGASDLLFHQDQPIFNRVFHDESGESSDDESLEAAFQKPPLKGKGGDGPP